MKFIIKHRNEKNEIEKIEDVIHRKFPKSTKYFINCNFQKLIIEKIMKMNEKRK